MFLRISVLFGTVLLGMARITSREGAAAHFGVSERSIRNWLRAGHIKGYRVPGTKRVVVDLDDIDAAMAAGKMPDTRKPFGPRAQIVDLPANVVIAEDGR